MTRRDFLAAAGASAIALRAAAAVAAETLSFAELYEGSGPLGRRFSERARQLSGRAVSVRGFPAPPLKPEASFFVLCATPVALCPFCQSDADWPHDIVVVYPKSGAAPAFRSAGAPVEVTGILELGGKTDADTGFVSQVRLAQASARPL